MKEFDESEDDPKDAVFDLNDDEYEQYLMHRLMYGEDCAIRNLNRG